MDSNAATRTELTGIRIREQLRADLAAEYASDDLILIDEFALLGGQTRADLVALNGTLKGFEIKGESDTLERLPHQAKLYGKVFDEVTLVVAPNHRSKSLRMAPKWWGLWLAECGPVITFTRIREGTENTQKCLFAIANLLWRNEALQLLDEHGLAHGHRSKPLRQLISVIVEKIPEKRLEFRVREMVKSRGDWLLGARQKQCDGRCRRRAMSLHSPVPLS